MKQSQDLAEVCITIHFHNYWAQFWHSTGWPPSQYLWVCQVQLLSSRHGPQQNSILHQRMYQEHCFYWVTAGCRAGNQAAMAEPHPHWPVAKKDHGDQKDKNLPGNWGAYLTTSPWDSWGDIHALSASPDDKAPSTIPLQVWSATGIVSCPLFLDKCSD